MSRKICHYTKDDNFNNIIKDYKFRAVLSTQSNDLKDTVLINELLINSTKKIVEEIVEASNEITVDGFTKILTGLFYKFHDDRTSNTSQNEKTKKCFVVCFTDKKDSRFLWDSYTKNKGVNLVFDDTKLRNYLNDYNKMQRIFEYFKFDPVIYQPEKQYGEVKKIVNKNYNKYMKNNDGSLSNISIPASYRLNFTDESGTVLYRGKRNDYLITLKTSFVNFATETINQLLDIAPFIKHAFWSEEREYRLTFYRTFQHDFLSEVMSDKKKDDRGNNVTYYYIEVPFAKDLLEEVKIGPLSRLETSDIINNINIHNSCIVSGSKGRGVLKY